MAAQAAAIEEHCAADDPEKVAKDAQQPLLTNVVQTEQSVEPEVPPPPGVPPVPCPPALPAPVPPVPVVPPVPALLPPVPVLPPVLPEVPPVLPPAVVQSPAFCMQVSNAVQSIMARHDWAVDASCAARGQLAVFACWAHIVEQVDAERPNVAAAAPKQVTSLLHAWLQIEV